MRLILGEGPGKFSLVERYDDNIPRYAILSHTWGADGEEVTFKDLMEGTGRNKDGYGKLDFCRKQAARDGLQFFWVDTCCIDKSSSAELTEAINSMFRWYQNATMCYVYLSDVSMPAHTGSVHMPPTTELAFRDSRWFHRGWTLQELIAPASVEFFSREGHLLGSKVSLEQQIHETTGITVKALRGGRLTDFSIEERFFWAKHRETKRPEDKAYSLLGIFSVHMPLIYGEGGEKAYLRLRKEIDTSQNYPLLKTISHVGDAAYNSYENQRHRTCLPDTRVDLLRKITDWATSDSSQYIFWLRGGAGTGKSTIAMTIAQSLDRPGVSLASFFFQRGRGDLARSRKVITTVAFQLATRSPLLRSFICEALQQDPNLGESASISQQYDKLLLSPLQQARKSAMVPLSFIVVLDALDECDDLTDVRLLFHLLGEVQKMEGLGLRILITSRPEDPIRPGFHNMSHIAYHEMALHDVDRAIVDQDIKIFVTHEMAQIRIERGLPDDWPEDDKIQTISTRADGLFIYAATVCRYVHANGDRRVSARARLEHVCQGIGGKHKLTEPLDEMYSFVLDSSMKGDFSADEAQELTVRLSQVVGSVILLFDNLSAVELARLLFPTDSSGGNTVYNTLYSLHSVFDIPEDLSKPIYMLHLSFQEFLVDSARCTDVRFQINQQQVHHNLLNHCLHLMERSLVQNICQLPSPGVLIDEVSEAALSQHLVFGLRYACRHWIEHAENSRVRLSDNGPVHSFLRQHCAYWLEAMALIGKTPEAVAMMIKLECLIDANKAPELQSFVQDTLRFIGTFNYMLSQAPIQLYHAGLLFSPANSVFRRSFSSHISADLEVRAQLLSEWNACTQILEGHLDGVNIVVFSPDGSQVASGSHDQTVRVWDVRTGQCEHTLNGHSGRVYSVVFSPNSSQVASGSHDQTVRVWDVRTGQCQHTLNGHSGGVNSVVFSPNSSQVASGSFDQTVRVWDMRTGQCEHTLKGHSSWVYSVVFSPNGSQVASGSADQTVRVWDVRTSQCEHIFEGHSGGVYSVVFSPNGSQVASGSFDQIVQVWDVRTGQCEHTLKGHSSLVCSVVFSPNGSQIISGSYDQTVRVWDVRTGQCEHTLNGHSGEVYSVVFSPNGSQVVSGSHDQTVRVWDVRTGPCKHTLKGHSSLVIIVVFSPNGSQVASGSADQTVRVWDVRTGQCEHTLNGHSGRVNSVVFSPDGSWLASGSNDETVRVWDVRIGQCQHTLKGHSSSVYRVVFSPNGLQVASGSFDDTVRVWNVWTGQCEHTLKGHSSWVCSVVFSLNGSQVASGSADQTVRVWDVQTGQCEHTLKGHSGWVNSVVFSPDGSRLASGSDDETVRVWDAVSSAGLMCYETGTDMHEIEFIDNSMKVLVNGDVLSISSKTQSASTAAGLSGPLPNINASKLSIKGDWVTLSLERVLWLPPEYRPGVWVSKGNTIAIGNNTGRVTFVSYPATHSTPTQHPQFATRMSIPTTKRLRSQLHSRTAQAPQADRLPQRTTFARPREESDQHSRLKKRRYTVNAR